MMSEPTRSYIAIPYKDPSDKDLDEVPLHSPEENKDNMILKEKEPLLLGDEVFSEEEDDEDFEYESESLHGRLAGFMDNAVARLKRSHRCHHMLGCLAFAVLVTIAMYFLYLDEATWPADVAYLAQKQLSAQPAWIPDQEIERLLSTLHFSSDSEQTTCQPLANIPIESFKSSMELKGHDIILKSYDPNVRLSVKVISGNVHEPILRIVRGHGVAANVFKGLVFETEHDKTSVTMDIRPVPRGSRQDQVCLLRSKKHLMKECHKQRGSEKSHRHRLNNRQRKGSRHPKRHHHQHCDDDHDHDRENGRDCERYKEKKSFCQYLPIGDQDMAPMSGSTASGIWKSETCPILLDVEIVIPNTPRKELCSLQLEGVIMDVDIQDPRTIYKKVNIANQQGKITIKDLRANKLSAYSMLSDIEVSGVRSGIGKKLEISAVSPVGEVGVQVRRAPASMLCLKAISGRSDVKVVLPKAYARQVALRNPSDKSLIVQETTGALEGDNPPRLRNRVHLESKGGATHASLSYN